MTDTIEQWNNRDNRTTTIDKRTIHMTETLKVAAMTEMTEDRYNRDDSNIQQIQQNDRYNITIEQQNDNNRTTDTINGRYKRTTEQQNDSNRLKNDRYDMDYKSNSYDRDDRGQM